MFMVMQMAEKMETQKLTDNERAQVETLDTWVEILGNCA